MTIDCDSNQQHSEESVETVGTSPQAGPGSLVVTAKQYMSAAEQRRVERLKSPATASLSTERDTPLTAEERRALVLKPFPIVKSYSGCSHGGTTGADVVSGQETADSIWSRRWGKRFGGRKPSMSEYENSSD
jgi:hypothetical protein